MEELLPKGALPASSDRIHVNPLIKIPVLDIRGSNRWVSYLFLVQSAVRKESAKLLLYCR